MRGWSLLVVLLLVPAGSAQTLHWLGPEEGTAHAPVFMAYEMADGTGGLEGHVNVKLTVSLDGHALFATDQIHEHEGFHTFAFSPPASGELVFTANVGGQDVRHTVAVEPAKEHDMPGFSQARFRAGQTTEGNNFATRADGAMGVSGTPGWALVEGRDLDGTLRFSSWQAPWSGGSLLRSEPWLAEAVFTDAPHLREGRGATHLNGGQWQPSGDSDQPVLLPGVPRPPTCGPDSMNVVLDPTSLSPAGNPQFQEHAAIRLAIRDNAYPEVAYIVFDAAAELSTGMVLAATAVDPYGQAILHPDGAGSMRLLVTGFGGESQRGQCQLFFDVTPNPAEPGSVDASLDERPLGMDVTLTPLSASGDILTHYEFDTRLLRMEDDGLGRLVYQGKLHGHSGATSFSFDNLEPGDYRLWTHPSPQDPAAPPVQPSDPVGFVYPFTVAAPTGSESVYVFSKEPGVAQGKTTPLPALPLLLAGLALMCLRRH